MVIEKNITHTIIKEFGLIFSWKGSLGNPPNSNPVPHLTMNGCCLAKDTMVFAQKKQLEQIAHFMSRKKVKQLCLPTVGKVGLKFDPDFGTHELS